MIHSKSTDGAEVLRFVEQYKAIGNRVPLVTVPTTYNELGWQQLRDAGFNIVVYANHLLRSAYPAMVAAAQSILRHDRSKEAEEKLIPVNELLKLIPNNYDPS